MLSIMELINILESVMSVNMTSVVQLAHLHCSQHQFELRSPPTIHIYGVGFIVIHYVWYQAARSQSGWNLIRLLEALIENKKSKI